MNNDLNTLVARLGEARAVQLLQDAVNASCDEAVLTIIANDKVHFLPESYKKGKTYIASSGNLDFSSIESVRREYYNVLQKLSSVLKGQHWNKIYLVPFGPTTLSMQIKMLVYRVTSIDTIDLFYDGKGGYSELQFEQRKIISDAV